MIRINRIAIVLLISIILSAYLPINTEAARTSIKVAVNCNLPPFQYFDNNGNVVGLYIDIMNDIAIKEDLIIEYITFDETSKALESLENGFVDAVLGVLSKNDTSFELQKTNDIYSATLCMLVENNDIARILHPEQDARRYSVAFELGTISFSQLSQLNAGNNIVVGNQVQLYNTLIKKNIDAVIGIKESMIYMLENNDTNDSYTIVHNYISSVNYSILTRRNDRVLYNSINRGISKLRASDNYEQLLDKWIVNSELEAAHEMRMKLMSYIRAFVIIALIIIAVISYISYQLKKTVAEKTKEIRHRVQQLENESVLRERLIEFLPAGIMMLKNDGSVLTMNSISRSIAGIKENERDDLNINDLNIIGEIYRRVGCDSTAAERPAVIKLNRDDSGSQIFRFQCQSINVENDKVMMVEDITEEEKEKHEIFELRKNKALSRIIAGMAHEIKNPLMSISTFASLIRTQGKDDDFQALFTQHVPEEVDRINRLINMLINYTRPMQSKKERVSVSELINDSLYIAQISEKKNEQIHLKVNSITEAYIYVNRDQIKQSLINIIINSIQSLEKKLSGNESKFPEGLSINVQSYRRNGQIYIEVYDEGLGMTESELEKCIEPFFTTKAKGLGMGLALVKQFVNENSGRMDLESCKDEYIVIKMIFEEDIE
ncbi:transporter substrate-binding domain-containing protein [Sedimentibacter sp.]|uniref:transporter substrate-binding domain-containing protein n=1 Tax=Sedimentibacter sp. TaxID=1960295 RepID=UPI00289705D6|nr:transporter substrate-binding domain-containing protein [Sedimentibacter sp.]